MKKSIALVFLVAAPVSSAIAQQMPASSAPGVATASQAMPMQQPMQQSGAGLAAQLSALQAQIPVLEAQAKIAKLQAEIKNPTGANGMASGAASGLVPGAAQGPAMAGMPAAAAYQLRPQTPEPAQIKRDRVDHKPELESITGYNGHLQAGIKVDGRIVIAHTGTILDGGWVVTNLTPTMVELRRGRQVTILTF